MHKIIVWGRGKVAEEILDEVSYYNHKFFEIIGVTDRDTLNVNTEEKFMNYRVVKANIIKLLDFDYIVILSDLYNIIKKDIHDFYGVPFGMIKGYELLGELIMELRPVKIALFYDDFFKKIYGGGGHTWVPDKMSIVAEGILDDMVTYGDLKDENVDYNIIAMQKGTLNNFTNYLNCKKENIRTEDFILKYKFEEKYKNSCTPVEHILLNRMKVRRKLDTYYFLDGPRRYFLENGSIDWNGKRLFLESIGEYVFEPYIEQINCSPHKYENEDVRIEEGDLLVDVGACEGNFSLYNIDKLGKAVLIECEDQWIDSLAKTFAPYGSKVEIYKNYISDCCNEYSNEITLDVLFRNQTIDFLKMDIEGMEIKALRGAVDLLKEKRIKKLAICCYHRHGDREKIMSILKSYGYLAWTSEYKMITQPWFDNTMYLEPEFRNGVVWGKINEEVVQ